MEENSRGEQLGFKKWDKRSHWTVRMIGERDQERGRGLNLCLINMEKAFDPLNVTPYLSYLLLIEHGDSTK